MRTIDLPPFAPMLIESTRAIGYSLESAIADIIDNSISAKAKNVSVNYFPFDIPYIAIIDDGLGMSEEKLTESMRYGCIDPTQERDLGDMGRYGLGLKTASLSQCRCLTVVTFNGIGIYARRWDIDHIKNTGKWELIVLEDNEIRELPLVEKLRIQKQGTIVIWHKLDKIYSGEINLEDAINKKMSLVEEHLALVFHRFLSGGDAINKIVLDMNNQTVKGFDPFFITKSTQVMDDEKIDIPHFNSSVEVRPYVLPHPSKMTKDEMEKYGGKDGLRKLQGFYIYRNKRLLIWGTWFRLTRMDEFSKLARVRVDIPNSLDELWTLDIKKSTAMPPEIVKIRLKQIIGKIIGKSKQTYSFRGRKETNDNILHIWNRIETREGIKYTINEEYPLYEKISESIDDNTKKMLDDYVYMIETNLPINTIHNDIYNERKIAKDSKSEELKGIKEQVKYFLQSAETKEDFDTILDMFSKTEPFCDYLREIKEMILEVSDERD